MTNNNKVAAVMTAGAAAARLLPHPWNFTPMMAMALYAGAKFSKTRTAILATLGALLLSDVFLGFYGGMWHVYLAALIPVLLGRWAGRRHSWTAIAAAAAVSSVSFYLLTNLMVWATGTMYPHTSSGLMSSYVAGLPFFRNQILGDAFYTVALFGIHALVERMSTPEPQAA